MEQGFLYQRLNMGRYSNKQIFSIDEHDEYTSDHLFYYHLESRDALIFKMKDLSQDVKEMVLLEL